MKRCLIFVSILALTACTTDSGGGSSNSSGGSYNQGISGGYSGTTNNNTNGGNTGGNTNSSTNNQQNNQVVHYTNFKQYFDNVLKQNSNGIYSDFVESAQNWPTHGGYKHYGYKLNSSTGTSHTITRYVIEEKEMQLLNYGVQNHDSQEEFESNYSDASSFYSAGGYVHNREGVGANLYTPTENTTFTGGTLAYLDTDANHSDMFIKGNATYKYNSEHPELLLAYDNYYTFNIVKGDGKTETTTVTGTNNTGDAFYDVTPGTYTDTSGYDATFTANHLQKGSIQEAGGTYEMDFGYGDIGGNTTNDFRLRGSFGGTKQ